MSEAKRLMEKFEFPEDELFNQAPKDIANLLYMNSKSKSEAMGKLNSYISSNSGSMKDSDKQRLEDAKQMLDQLYV